MADGVQKQDGLLMAVSDSFFNNFIISLIFRISLQLVSLPPV